MADKISTFLNHIPDPATRDAVRKITNILVADIKANNTKFDNHTHAADGSQGGAYNTSTPQSDAATVNAGTASAMQLSLDLDLV